MLAFLLGLLKIIGIVLLVILLVVLLLVAVVLLVPIKYEAGGILTEEKKQAKANVTWLCKLVRLKIDYNFPEKPLISLKILWIELLKEKKTKKEKKPKEPKLPKEEKSKKEKKQKYHPAVNIALLEAADAEEAARVEAAKETADKEAKEVYEKDEASTEITQENSDTSAKEPEQVEESGNKIEKIIFKIQRLYDKINKIIDNINYYLDILEEDDTQGLIKNAWGAILKILNSMKPKIFRVNAIVGFDMPDTTGRVYGYYCMLMPWLIDDINIEPDFEQKIINGDIYINGKIRILTILVNALRIIFDKRLKPLIKKIKNGGK